MTHPTTRQPTTPPVEVKAGARDGVAGTLGATTRPETAAVFLSPRVVDQAAFEDYAQRLRSLMDETGSTADDVRASLDEIRALRTETTESLTRQRAVIDAGSKLVRAVEARTSALEKARANAESIIERLDAAATRAEQAGADLDARIDTLIEQRLAKVEEQVDARVRALTADIERKLERRVAEMTTTLAQIDEKRAGLEELVRDATDNTLSALTDAHERAARLAGWDPEDIVDGAGVGQPARDSLADLMLRAEAMQRDAKGAIERLSSLRDESRELVEGASGALDTTREELLRLDTERESLEDRVARARDETARLASANQPLIEMQQRSEQTASQLASLLVQTRSLREEGSASEERLRAAVDEADRAMRALEPWRDVCFASEDEASRAGLPPVLRAITDRFREGLARDISEMASAFQRIAERGASDVNPR